MLPVLLFPGFDPVAIHLGPFAIRWYALAYIVGLLLGWRLTRRLAAKPPPVASESEVDDFLTWATLGVIIGGRLGYVLFYQPSYYLSHPLAIVAVWRGGMSFHGGALGVIAAIVLFTLRRHIDMLGFADRIAVSVPIGLGLGRIANFINGELFGRPAPAWLPWAMIFPQAGPVPRHPSQLYQALLEGALLFVLLYALAHSQRLRARRGFLSGCFLSGYAVARSVGELFRQPDPFLGYLWAGATMGQLLSLPMLAGGIALMILAFRRPPARDGTVGSLHGPRQ
jgi:phosphatidylglycerol:prolipoprotein diacylglycerol transferase